jgi:hypothetical protein
MHAVITSHPQGGTVRIPHPRRRSAAPARGRSHRSPAELDRLFSVGIGGAFLGASLAGTPGAIAVALIGLISAASVNRSHRLRANAG